ncbi:MAG: hypothetical protein IH934_07705, partial [Nanoarchaeota archaeon]|nr:hypothetical protein [Nanoarchaeota archaeon]
HKSLSENSSYKPHIIDTSKKIVEHYEIVLPAQKTVTLVINDNLLKLLAKGKVTRTGGVVRTKNGKIFKHLVDVKPNKISKAIKIVNVAFIAFDIIEHAIIDAKLKEILKLVKEIVEKLDAQNMGEYESAIKQFIELSKHTNLRAREKRIPIIQNELSKSEEIFKKLYEAKWIEYNDIKAKFNKAVYFSNKIQNDIQFFTLKIDSCFPATDFSTV